MSTAWIHYHLILVDEEKLVVAFTELLSNAIKYTPDGGRIFITGDQGKENTAIIEIRDTGIGIQAEQLRYTFDLILYLK